jgi:hypothetical protein
VRRAGRGGRRLRVGGAGVRAAVRGGAVGAGGARAAAARRARRGRWEAALRQAGRERDGGPSDALLRELYRGTAAYYGARWDEGALAFQRAAAAADDRYTKRVSRGALALATNDRALPYVPGDNERLFAHYYAALGYLHAGDLNGAAVEARRLAYRLQQADARRDPLDASARAALRYFTGAVFEAAGDREDAEVAYRNAAALGAEVDADVARRAEADSAMRGTGGRAARGGAGRARPPAAAPAGPGAGDVVVLVERGFVAHRVNERLSVRLDGDAADRLALWGGGAAPADGRDADAAAGALGARLAQLLGGDRALWAGGAPASLAVAGDDVPAPAAPPAPPPPDGPPAAAAAGPAAAAGDAVVAAAVARGPAGRAPAVVVVGAPGRGGGVARRGAGEVPAASAAHGGPPDAAPARADDGGRGAGAPTGRGRSPSPGPPTAAPRRGGPGPRCWSAARAARPRRAGRPAAGRARRSRAATCRSPPPATSSATAARCSRGSSRAPPSGPPWRARPGASAGGSTTWCGSCRTPRSRPTRARGTCSPASCGWCACGCPRARTRWRSTPAGGACR